MARKSSQSSTTDEDDFSLDLGDMFGGGQEAATPRVYSAEELDRRELRAAHQAAAALAADSGFVTEVVGDPAEVAQVAAIGRRLALFSRDRGERERLLREFAADIVDGPVEFLPAEAVLESERLLEEMHRAVCRREGWDEGMGVEEVIGRLRADEV